MDAPALAALVRVACVAVRAAGRLTTAVQRDAIGGSAAFVSKADASPVTTADFGAQAVVSSILRAAIDRGEISGPFRCVGEESSASLRSGGSLLASVVAAVESSLPGIAAAGRERAWSAGSVCDAIDAGAYDGDPREAYWVLDPVDGTKGFLRGASGQYAVGLAYVSAGRPVVAAIACPNLPFPAWSAASPPAVGTLFSAIAGGGSLMEPLDSSSGAAAAAVRIHASSTADPAHAVFCESFDAAHSDHRASHSVATDLGITREPLRLDSMCKYGMLARGDADLYLRFPRPGYVENVWDHAPGALLVQEAGGCVTDVMGAPLDFSKGKGLSANRGVVVSNGRLPHARVLAAAAAALAL